VDAVEGVKYALHFSLAARPDAPLSTQTVQVFWNGTLVDSIHALGGGFVSYIREVTGAAGPDSLTFRELGTENDGLGSLVDRVSLTAFDWSHAVDGVCPPEEGDDEDDEDDDDGGDDGHREIQGSDGDDNFVCGGAGDHVLRGGLGDDTIFGGPGFDDINGNQGNDTLSGGAGGDWVVGGKDNDSLSGGAGDDIVWGNRGADTCDGGDGNDQVRGGLGDDSLAGGAGNDFVSGDRGNDTVSGGAGADMFHSSQDAGVDRVLDFNLAEGDRVQLDPGTTYTLMQVGADAVLDMGGGNQMILVGVQSATLTSGWVFFG
jgi:Ca2+-binding RTX toxin-like protein